MRSTTGDLIVIGSSAFWLLHWEEMIAGEKKKKGKPIIRLAIIQVQDGGLDKVYSDTRKNGPTLYAF